MARCDVAKELVDGKDEYLLLVPDGENFTYLWLVTSDSRKEDFKKALVELLEA